MSSLCSPGLGIGPTAPGVSENFTVSPATYVLPPSRLSVSTSILRSHRWGSFAACGIVDTGPHGTPFGARVSTISATVLSLAHAATCASIQSPFLARSETLEARGSVIRSSRLVARQNRSHIFCWTAIMKTHPSFVLYVLEGARVPVRLPSRCGSLPVAIGTELTESRDVDHDNPRIELLQRLVAEAHLVHHAGAEVLQDHVGLHQQFAQNRLALLAAQIQSDGFLAAIVLRPVDHAEA